MGWRVSERRNGEVLHSADVADLRHEHRARGIAGIEMVSLCMGDFMKTANAIYRTRTCSATILSAV